MVNEYIADDVETAAMEWLRREAPELSRELEAPDEAFAGRAPYCAARMLKYRLARLLESRGYAVSGSASMGPRPACEAGVPDEYWDIHDAAAAAATVDVPVPPEMGAWCVLAPESGSSPGATRVLRRVGQARAASGVRRGPRW